MKYEIGNPSDRCFLEADDDRIAVACILFLGNGQYFCKNVETDESIAGAFFAMGGDVEETWKYFHGVGLDEFLSLPETRKKMQICFNTFYYSSERSSMNNIEMHAKRLSESILS